MEFITILFVLILLVSIIIAYRIGHGAGSFRASQQFKQEIPFHRKDAVLRSRAVISGQFSEQLAPFLPNFPFSPTECKFLGKPIDLLVFRGLDNKFIEEVVFVEVKSGDSKLNKSEKSLKNAVENGRVKWKEYKVPKDLTKND